MKLQITKSKMEDDIFFFYFLLGSIFYFICLGLLSVIDRVVVIGYILIIFVMVRIPIIKIKILKEKR